MQIAVGKEINYHDPPLYYTPQPQPNTTPDNQRQRFPPPRN